MAANNFGIKVEAWTYIACTCTSRSVASNEGAWLMMDRALQAHLGRLCSALQARQNAKASGQTFYDVSVVQALVGTMGSSLPESLRPRVSALSPHQVSLPRMVVSCLIPSCPVLWRSAIVRCILFAVESRPGAHRCLFLFCLDHGDT